MNDSLSLLIAIGDFSTITCKREQSDVAKFLSEDSSSSTMPSRVALSASESEPDFEKIAYLH